MLKAVQVEPSVFSLGHFVLAVGVSSDFPQGKQTCPSVNYASHCSQPMKGKELMCTSDGAPLW